MILVGLIMSGNASSGRRPAHEEMKLRKGEISTRQLSSETGVSMHTLDQWTNAGFITMAYVDGEGKGGRRVYKEKVAVLEVIELIRVIGNCPYGHKTA